MDGSARTAWACAVLASGVLVGCPQATVRGGPSINVAVAPPAAYVVVGESVQFTSTVTGTTNSGVVWSVSEAAACGSVTQAGLYSAPSTPAVCHVVATSVADARRSAAAAVTVATAPPTSIAISPSSAIVAAGGTQQFTVAPPAAVTWGVEETAGVLPGLAFPLKVSASGRFLTDQNGTPFRIQSDAAWLMTTRAEAADVDAYLSDRKAKGFNTLVLMATVNAGYSPGAGNDGNEPYDRAGDLPWLSSTSGAAYTSPATQVPDLSTPNPAYWTWVDTILAKAQGQGFAVLFFPLYLGYAGQAQGWWAALVDDGNSQATAYAFGQWLGQRYKAFPNIVWMMGGDFGPTASGWTAEGEARDHKILEGIQSAGATQAVGAQWGGPDTLAVDTGSFAALMNVDTFYGYGPGSNDLPYQTADRAWRVTPPRPALLFEPRYEDDYLAANGSAAETARSAVRFYQWSSVLAGSTAGQCFGTYGVWNWLGQASGSFAWSARLSSLASQDMAKAFALWAELPWWDHRPSGTAAGYLGRKIVVTSNPDGNGHIAASADGNGTATSLIAYVPPTGTGTTTFSVDLRCMAGNSRARWLNPTSGAFADITAGAYTLPNTIAAQSFVTPGNNGTGTNDWLLVLDAVAPRCGSISGTGLYTAPSSVPVGVQCQVTATLQADSTIVARASVVVR